MGAWGHLLGAGRHLKFPCGHARVSRMGGPVLRARTLLSGAGDAPSCRAWGAGHVPAGVLPGRQGTALPTGDGWGRGGGSGQALRVAACSLLRVRDGRVAQGHRGVLPPCSTRGCSPLLGAAGGGASKGGRGKAQAQQVSPLPGEPARRHYMLFLPPPPRRYRRRRMQSSPVSGWVEQASR